MRCKTFIGMPDGFRYNISRHKTLPLTSSSGCIITHSTITDTRERELGKICHDHKNILKKIKFFWIRNILKMQYISVRDLRWLVRNSKNLIYPLEDADKQNPFLRCHLYFIGNRNLIAFSLIAIRPKLKKEIWLPGEKTGGKKREPISEMIK